MKFPILSRLLLLAALAVRISGVASAVETPTLLKEIGRQSVYEGSEPRFHTAVGAAGTSAVFFAWPGADNVHLYLTDGTSGGTTLIRSFPNSSSPHDGSVGGAARVGSLVYFTIKGSAGHWELWKTDGTSVGTVLVKSVDGRDSGGNYIDTPSQLTAIGSKVVFSAYTGDTGREPWVSDGTSAGTFRLADVFPGADGLGRPNESLPDNLKLCNGIVYFSADNGIHGRELWKTDGTIAGTSMLKDLFATGSSYPGGFTHSNGYTYFTASGEGVFNNPPETFATSEIWRTDGTAAGTIRVHYQSAEFTLGGFWSVGNGTVFVRAHRFSGGLGGSINETKGQFYFTDGTPGGTVSYGGTPGDALSPLGVIGQLTDGTIVYSGRGSGLFPNFTGRLAFLSGGAMGEVLTGNTEAYQIVGGTLYILISRPYLPATFFRYNPALPPNDILTNLGTFSDFPTLHTAAGKLFANYSGPPSAPTGIEPYAVSQNGAMTLLKDVATGATVYNSTDGVSNNVVLHNLNGTLVFPADGDTGYELWKSDGTETGTTVLRDIIPGTGGHNPGFEPSLPGLRPFVRSGNRLFFVRQDPLAQMSELWVTDGTEAGTQLLHSRENSFLYNIRPHPQGIWWTENDYNTNENELWISDGTEAGTRHVKTIPFAASGGEPIADFNNTAYVVSSDSVTADLWEINPDPALTRIVFNFRQPGDSMAYPQSMTIVNGVLHFLILRTDGTSFLQRVELWKMNPDGTPTLVKAFPYSNYTTSGFAIAGSTRLWFSFTDGTINPETSNYNATLYQSDGTNAGTVAVAGFPLYSEFVQTLGDRLYFGGTFDSAGYELWTTDGSAPVRLTGSATPHPYLSQGTSPSGFAKGGDGFVYFDASFVENDLVKRRIWRVSGTTVEAFGDLPYPESSFGTIFPRSLTWANNRLYASAYQPDSGRELYWWPAPAPATPFSSWAALNGLTGNNALPGEDADKDGVKNIVEFYNGSLPGNASSSSKPAFSTISPAGTPIRIISFPRMPGTGLTMTLESSVDLVNWNTDVTFSPAGTHTYNPSFKRTAIYTRTGSSPETITFAVTPANAYPKVFVRFRVSE